MLSFGVEAVARFAALVRRQSVAKEKAVKRYIPHAHPGELFVDPIAAEKEVLSFGECGHMFVERGAVPDMMTPFPLPLLKGSLLDANFPRSQIRWNIQGVFVLGSTFFGELVRSFVSSNAEVRWHPYRL